MNQDKRDQECIAFMCKAANCHHDLLSSLKNLLNYLESDSMRDPDMDKARAAISQAEK